MSGTPENRCATASPMRPRPERWAAAKRYSWNMATTKRARAKGGKDGVTFDDVRELARQLPGVEEGSCYGTPGLRVKGKFLLRLREDAETVAIKIPMDARE